MNWFYHSSSHIAPLIFQIMNHFSLHFYNLNFIVENILKGSLDSIPSPSPSVKIQIMGGKNYFLVFDNQTNKPETDISQFITSFKTSQMIGTLI